MLSIEVSVSEVAVHLCIGPRHRKPNTSKHVVSGDPVDVVLIDLGANDYAVFVLVFSALSLARPFLADMLGPARSVFVLWHLVEVHV